MPKALFLILALAFSGAFVFTPPARAQDKDRALLSTFCDAANIKGSTCKRARFYPNAGHRGCDVTLTGDRVRGRFVVSGNSVLVANYESGCESHATDEGGSIVFEEVGGNYFFRSFQPGMQSGDCVTVATDERQDRLVCLNGHIGQGIVETSVALMNFTQGAGNAVGMSVDMMLTAEDSIGAYGANVVTCTEQLTYFEVSKLAAGPRQGTVTVDASYADAETIKTACGKGFPKPAETFGELAPGEAYVPEGSEKNGKLVIDLATRKVTPQ